jgi:hypothetical protein
MLKTFVIIFLYKVNIEITTVHALAVKRIFYLASILEIEGVIHCTKFQNKIIYFNILRNISSSAYFTLSYHLHNLKLRNSPSALKLLAG